MTTKKEINKFYKGLSNYAEIIIVTFCLFSLINLGILFESFLLILGFTMLGLFEISKLKGDTK